jgi:trimeric autotransporter adhesin
LRRGPGPSLPFGSNNLASGDGSTAIGTGAQAVGVNTTAIGRAAYAGFGNSTAIGAGAVSTKGNQVRLGATGTSVSIADIGFSDAQQTGQEFFLTIDNSGTVGKGAQSSAALLQMGSQIESLQTQQALIDDTVATHTTQIAGLTQGLRQSEAGIAAAMAMGGTVMPSDAKFAMSFNLAAYRGQQGFSGSAVVRASRNVYFQAGVAGSSVKGSTGGRAGVTVAW